MKNPKFLKFVYQTPKSSSKQDLISFFGPGKIFFYPYARNALKEGLLTLDFKPFDEILIPSFICRDLLGVFNELNIKITYFDLFEDLSPILPEKTNAKAVLAVNYFGFTNHFSTYQEFARKFKLYLIEDNAHGFLSYDDKNQLLGTRGDIGIYSLRKTFSLPLGAALFIKPNLNNLYMPQILPTISLKLSFKIKKCISYLSPFLIFKIIILIRFFRLFFYGKKIITSTPEAEKVVPKLEFNYPFSNILENADFQIESEKRIYLFNWCNQYLNQFEIVPLFKQLPKKTIPYSYIFRCNQNTAQKIQCFLNQFQLEIFQWPDLPDNVKSNSPKHYNDLFCVRFIW
jgi:hypothetical protein